MDRGTIVAGFAALAGTATLVGLFLATRSAVLQPLPRRHPVSIVWHPLAQFLVVCGLLFVNQILCSAYILRVHDGDVKFVAQYLGHGWFDISTAQPIRDLAQILPVDLLGPTVLRVQAVLELPFALFAYLAVARMLGRDTHRRLVQWPMLAAASLAFTGAFCLAEMMLWNPWTTQDLILRGIAAIGTPLWVRAASHFEGETDEQRPHGAFGLAAFLAGAIAIAALVLVAYDAFLLYNLAHLSRYTFVIAGAVPIALVATWAAPRIDRRLRSAPSATMESVAVALETFTRVFFVPSLALRYASTQPIAQLAGLVLVGFGAAAGIAHLRSRSRTWWLELSIAGACGALVAIVVSRGLGPRVMPEIQLAVMTIGFLATAIIVLRAVERRPRADDAR